MASHSTGCLEVNAGSSSGPLPSAAPARGVCELLGMEVQDCSFNQAASNMLHPAPAESTRRGKGGGGSRPAASPLKRHHVHILGWKYERISWLEELPNSRVGNQGRFQNLLQRSLETRYNLTYRRQLFFFQSCLETEGAGAQSALLSGTRSLPPPAPFVCIYASWTISFPPREAHVQSALGLVFIRFLAFTPFLVILGKAGQRSGCPITPTALGGHIRCPGTTERGFQSQPRLRSGSETREN